MILFIYYRRSLWFMLPGAILVGFSRIYNGVHYPERCAGGSDPGRGLRRGGGLVPECALAVGRAQVVPALVAKVAFPARPGPAGGPKRRDAPGPESVSHRPPCAEFGHSRDTSAAASPHDPRRGPALAAARLPLDRGLPAGPAGLHRRRDHSTERGRSLPMALVQAPGAFLLQQAAAHRLHAIPRHLALGRHRLRRAFLLAR